jgi:O-antigen biosynthesis protein
MADIIVPVFNGEVFAAECLRILCENTDLSSHNVIVVDNGSKAGDWLVDICDEQPIDVVWVPENKGFSYALNAGVERGTADLVAVVHSDTFVPKGWMEALAGARVGADQEVAVVMPTTCWSSEPCLVLEDKKREFASLRISGKRADLAHVKSVMSRLYPEGLGGFQRKLGGRPTERVHSLDTYCALFTRDALERVGPFDVDFFPRGYEDAEWFLRAQRKGYEAWVARSAYVHHWGSASYDAAFQPWVRQKLKTLYTSKENSFYAR